MSVNSKSSSFFKSNLKHATLAGIGLIVSVIRNKITAVILGPDGIGLLGLLQNWLNLVARMSALGLCTVGTQQISKAIYEGNYIRSYNLIFVVFAVPLTVSTIMSFVILFEPKAVIGIQLNHDLAQVVMLCIGLVLTVLYMSMESVARAHKITDKFVITNLLGSITAIFCAVAIMIYFKQYGVYALLLLSPLFSLLLLKYEIVGLFKLGFKFKKEVISLVKPMLILGLPVVCSVPFAIGGQYMSKILIFDSYGSDNLGYFQAACTLSYASIGFLVSAMNLNFYPKLAEAISKDITSSSAIISKQIQFGLIISLPVVLALMVFGDFFISKLYSSEFITAIGVFKLQIIGDYLRLIYMPIFFVSLATARTKNYLVIEIASGLVYVGTVFAVTKFLNFEFLGFALIIQSLLYIILCIVNAKKIINHKFDAITKFTCVLCVFLLILVFFSDRRYI